MTKNKLAPRKNAAASKKPLKAKGKVSTPSTPARATSAPHFRQTGKRMELVIPLTSTQERNLKTIQEGFPNDGETLVHFHVDGVLDWLENLNNEPWGLISEYCDYAGKSQQETYDALAHFFRLGWVMPVELERAFRALHGLDKLTE